MGKALLFFTLNFSLIVFFAFGVVTNGFADNPTHSRLANPALDGVYAHYIANFHSTIQSYQATYYGSKGRYFQGFPTHRAIPENPQRADNMEAIPRDQLENWLSIMASPTISYSIHIDNYASISGDGYVITLSKVDRGVTWARIIDMGPVDNYSRAWHEVD